MRLTKIKWLVASVAGAAVLTGCTTNPANQQETAAAENRDIIFEMRGNEPFWRAEVAATEVYLHRMGEAEARYSIKQQPAPGPRQIYQLQAMNERSTALVTVDQMLCHDSMSGMPYPQQVLWSTEQGEVLRGCAGHPSALLVGSEWHITALQGVAVAADINATIQFDDTGAVFGSSGCNRYTGGYQLTGENLQFSQFASTRMACAQAHMQFEDQLLSKFAQVTGFTFDDAGYLQILLSDGGSISARR